jgi:hypothetical protein
MSKDMLNIDDFMRERLGSHSEKEDPNAWLKMKALLDEEMPERAVPFYFRLRKPLAFIGAALLAGVLCVGGYRIHALRSGAGAPGGSEAGPAEKTKGQAHPLAAHEELNSSPLEPTTAATATANEKPVTGTMEAPHKSTSNASVANKKTVGQAPGLSAAETALQSAPIPLPSETRNAPKSAPEASAPANEQKAVASRSPRKTIWASAKAIPTTNEHGSRKDKLHSSTVDAGQTEPQISKGLAASSKSRRSLRKMLNSIATAPAKVQQPATDPTGVASESRENKKADSIKAILTVNKPAHVDRNSRTVTYVTDTVSEQKVAVPETVSDKNVTAVNQNLADQLPAPGQQDQKVAAKENKKNNKQWAKKEARHQKELFNGASPKDLAANKNSEVAKNKENNTMAAVSAHRKNAIARFVENLHLDENAAEAKRTIGNADKYFGFSLGGNYSLSGSSDFRGIQFGPTGEVVFNKHWSFFTALRYFNRSGASRRIDDNYTEDVSSNVPDSIRGSNYYFKIFTDSTTRQFTFSTVQSLEMPLSVRYSIRNFYVMTGLNLVYTLPVNVELYQKNEGTQRSYVVPTNSTSKPIIENAGGNYDASSFKGRFGLGYILGAGYRFAPAWHADVQLVNTFWDNSKQGGAKDVSKNFFRVPSVQFSIGFQFNRGTKKPTFGPTSSTR